MTVEEVMTWRSPKRRFEVKTKSEGSASMGPKLTIVKGREFSDTRDEYVTTLRGDRSIRRKSESVSLRDRARIFNPGG